VTRILGVDPGSRITGFGIIESDGLRATHIASGCVWAEGETLVGRLRQIFEGLIDLISCHQPQEMVIEQVFLHRNPASALKLGQARGAAICAAAVRDIPVFEYTPAQVKQAVVGKGAAAKEQVQYMVKALLALSGELQADAADALAIAICHGSRSRMAARAGTLRSWRRGRWR
jgi:crossover junction endodeoxyribonuclease RuvC